MQQHIGRARRHRPQRRADDGRDCQIGLDHRMLEIFVEVIRNAHRPEADHVADLRLGQVEQLAAQKGQFRQITRPEAGRIGRGAHQQRADEAAMAQDIARIAVIGLGIALGMAGKFAAVRIMVAEHAKVVAAFHQHRAPLIGQNLQPVPGQFQIAHDFRAEQRRDIGTVGIGEARIQLAADGRTADPVVLLDDANLQPRLCQIAGGDQAIMPCADDHGIIGHARFSASTCSSVASTAVSTAFSVSARQAASCASQMNQGSRLSGSQMMPRSCR